MIVAQQTSVKFSRLVPGEDMSQNSITYILQDQKGFMWLGTKNGLIRYDGYNFNYYLNDPRDTNTVCGDFVRWICEDVNGLLWIGTDRNGFCYYDPAYDKFSTMKHIPSGTNSKNDNLVWCILEDNEKKGEVFWLATMKSGFVKFDYKKNKYTIFRHEEGNPLSLATDNLIVLCQDKKGYIWIGTLDSGLIKFDKKKNIFITYSHDPENPHSISSNYVWSIVEDPEPDNHILWIGTNGGGLNKFDVTREEFTSYRYQKGNPNGISSDIILSIFHDKREKHKTFWIATWGGGLNKFLPEGNAEHEPGKFIRYSFVQDNPYNNTSAHNLFITEDRAGTIWIGTQNEGVNLAERSKWKFDSRRSFPKYPDKLTNSPVTSICSDHSGNLWFATNGFGLFKHNQKTGTFSQFLPTDNENNSISNKYVLAVYPGGNNSVWVATSLGLDRLFYKTGEIVHYNHLPDDTCSLSSMYTSSICEVKPGILWVGTNNKGINVIEQNQLCITKIRHIPGNGNSLNSDKVRFIHKDTKSRIWIGSLAGLNLYSPQLFPVESFRYDVDDIKSLSNNSVLCFLEDHSGTIWIGTRRGLNRFNEKSKSFEIFTKEDGLISNSIVGILEDDNKNLWLSTNKGIVRFNPADTSFRNYDISDGLQNNEFNSDACFKSIVGELFFGGPNGFDAFYPAEVKDNLYKPPVYITSFKKFNREFALPQSIIETKEIELTYKDDFFSFEFTALNFINPEKVMYKYMLQGFNDDWIYLGNNRTASFTGLRPGNYKLLVQVSNNDKIWNPEVRMLSIIISPPYWQTWWFRGLIIFALLLVIYFVYEIRLRNIQIQKDKLEGLVNERTGELRESEKQLKAASAAKDKFFSIISHDLKSPLSGVMRLTEFLEVNFGKYPDEEKVSILHTVNKTVKKIYNLIENLLSWSGMQTGRIVINKDAFDLKELVQKIRELLSVYAEERGVEMVTKIDKETVVYADMEMISTVLRNLLSNAIKFTPKGGKVTVFVKRRKNLFEICVKDTGIGIEKCDIPKLFKEDVVFKKRGAGGEEGTGIGLLLCKEFVEKNDGCIWAESNSGKGSVFCFSIPAGHKKCN